jgi:hypothetical protein
MLFPPDDTVRRIISMKRVHRTWVNNHRTINFSGLVQAYITEMIKEKDPEYYEKYKEILESPMRKNDVTQQIMTDTSPKKLIASMS